MGSLENPFFRKEGGHKKKQSIEGDGLKRGLGQFAELREGALQKRAMHFV